MWMHEIAREWVRTVRHPMGVILPSLFYMIILIMFMFIDTPDTAQWVALLPRLILVPAFLAMLMIPSQLFDPDYQSGYLQYYMINRETLFRLMLLRLTTVGCIYLLPLIFIAIGFSMMMGLSAPLINAMLMALSLALPTLFVMAAFAGALTLALPQAPLLQAVILMPLYIPVLLFSQSLIMRAQLGLSYMAFVYLLLAMMLLGLVFLPKLICIILQWAYE